MGIDLPRVQVGEGGVEDMTDGRPYLGSRRTGGRPGLEEHAPSEIFTPHTLHTDLAVHRLPAAGTCDF